MGTQVLSVINNTEVQLNQAILLIAKRNSTTGAHFGFLPIGAMQPGLQATTTIEFITVPDTGGIVRVSDAIKIKQQVGGQIAGTVYGVKPEVRRALLYGEDVDVAAGSAVVETVWAEKGRVLALSNIMVSALTSVTGVGGTPTYTDTGTLNASYGGLILPDTGDLATDIDAETAMADGVKRLQVEVTYDHDAYTLTRGLLSASEEFWVRVELYDTNGQKVGVVNGFRTNLNPAENFPLISADGEAATFPVSFDLLIDPFRAADPVINYLAEI